MNKKLMKQLLTCNPAQLRNSIAEFLKKYYNEEDIVHANDYIFVSGDIPICLTAHLDTVYKYTITEDYIFYDQEKKVMFSYAGLGADDRAGVYAILTLLKQGFKPHLIFTMGEEDGCIGAQILITDYKKCPFPQCNYIISLDRKGIDDAVFYRCANERFIEYIESFDFYKASGSYSDISFIAPAWGIAAVNLSIGYINEHSDAETLFVEDMEATIEKVGKMLNDIDAIDIKYEYIAAPIPTPKKWDV